MPLIFQDFIYRRDLRQHPDRLYLFGDNEKRLGFGGQARQMRDEPNAVGVRTKREPSLDPHAMWSDAEFDRCVAMIDKDLAPAFDHLRRGGEVVCPRNGIGNGLAGLPKNAPRIWAYLRGRLVEMARIGEK